MEMHLIHQNSENDLENTEISPSSDSQLECKSYSIQVSKSSFFWGIDEDFGDSDSDSDEKVEESSTDEKGKICDKSINNQSTDSSNEGSDAEDDDLETLNKKITLKDIHLNIKKNEFVAIIGDVGSGKSSLLSTLLGETSYVPQSIIDQYGEKDLKREKDQK